jgi:hypothetical protein
MSSLNDFAVSLINNVSFAKGAVLNPSRKDINDISKLIKVLDLHDHNSILLLLYGPLPNSIKNTPNYKALYRRLELIPILRMSDEPQAGGTNIFS